MKWSLASQGKVIRDKLLFLQERSSENSRTSSALRDQRPSLTFTYRSTNFGTDSTCGPSVLHRHQMVRFLDGFDDGIQVKRPERAQIYDLKIERASKDEHQTGIESSLELRRYGTKRKKCQSQSISKKCAVVLRWILETFSQLNSVAYCRN